jgi:diguanylate cyclase (GGDEF)-like protein/PAS domain S-box-containing protein
MNTKPANESDQLRLMAIATLLEASSGTKDEELIHELHVHQIELEMQNEQLRQAQEEIETSRDRFVELYEFSPVSYLTVNQNGTIESANLTASTLLGVSRKELIDRAFSNIVKDSDIDCWRSKFNRIKLLECGDEFSFDIQAKRHDGGDLCLRVNCLRVKSGFGDDIARIALTDITERKKLEEIQRISAIAFETQDGIFVTDANAVIIRVNKAFTRISGYSSEEAIGQTPHLLSSGKQDQDFYKKMWNSINAAGSWQGEIVNKHKDGSLYTEHLSVTAVKDELGVLTNYVSSFIDVTETKAAEERINELAFFDPLTLLPNRRLFIDRLSQAISISRRSGQYHAVLFLDLDNFKIINDTHGHDKGDMLLKQVALRITQCLRASDTAARMGGDEFVVLLEGLGERDLAAASFTTDIGQKLLAVLYKIYDLEGYEYQSSVSIGATLFGPESTNVNEILKQADIAMYQAKSEGRDTMRFYSPEMQRLINDRVTLEQDLKIAVDQQQFELFYQIQVDSSGRATGAEALIRWNHPRRGLLSPMEFIPQAEETGLIIPIGQWVIETACKQLQQLQQWQDSPSTQNLPISINVSAKQFAQADFAKKLCLVVEDFGIDPQLLNLELTETLLVKNIGSIAIKMSELKQLGFDFELDDFGTGYSSLQYLKKLPIARLKIDQSFVKDIIDDPSDKAIVSTIIAMAHSLEFDVIAEGVETKEHMETLLDMGCRSFQGYHFGRPVPVCEYEALLKSKVLTG